MGLAGHVLGDIGLGFRCAPRFALGGVGGERDATRAPCRSPARRSRPRRRCRALRRRWATARRRATSSCRALPQLLAEVRRERATRAARARSRLRAAAATLAEVVRQDHHRADRGVEPHGLDVLRDLLDRLVDELLASRRRCAVGELAGAEALRRDRGSGARPGCRSSARASPARADP